MEGGDANPGQWRDNLISPAPKSFTPEYGKNTVKSSADLAAEENKKNRDANPGQWRDNLISPAPKSF